MKLLPQNIISEQELNAGMLNVIRDGLASETMTALSSGAFLVATAILLGATNFQIGLIAGLPAFMNIFQLITIWLVRRFKNRRAVSIICSSLARLSLISVGAITLLTAGNSGISIFILFLSSYYFFASLAGVSWNSWMKDLIPEDKLGSFFSKRTMFTQILNITVSLIAALSVDYLKANLPGYELSFYSAMFIVAGVFGLLGVIFLYRTPEPVPYLSNENIFKLLRQTLKNKNFRNLLVFNSAWVFAINIAVPFFTVYMLKTLNLPISYIIALSIVTQLSGIFTVKLWGLFADRYSNKTIIGICAPLYILCITAWCFVGLVPRQNINLILLAVIHLFSGISTAGINLSLINIGLKLSPREDAIVYLSSKNIITAFFSASSTFAGGYIAGYFANRHIDIFTQYGGPSISKRFHLLSLHQWNFLFVIGALLAIVAIQFLANVQEKGEVEKDIVVRIMRSSIRNNMKDYFIVGSLLEWRKQFHSKISKIFSSDEKGN